MSKFRVLILFSLMVMGLRAAYAGGQVGELIFRQGVVVFEKHFTLVPFEICDVARYCPKSHPYWVVSVLADGERYQIDQRFHEGESDAPEWVEFDGLQIRPNKMLSFEGRVEYVGSDFYLLDQFRPASSEMLH